MTTRKRKLTLRYLAPAEVNASVESLGVWREETFQYYGDGKSKKLVVLKGQCPAYIQVPRGHFLAGATILRLPEGAEFEIWEEDTPPSVLQETSNPKASL
jgi:hypothetical protein